MPGLVGITAAQPFRILSGDDKEVVRFCQIFGLLPKSHVCSVCHTAGRLAFNRGRSGKAISWRCRLAACQCGEVSIRDRTVFERSKLTIAIILHLLFLWSMRRSVEEAVAETKTSRTTVVIWFKFCRQICIEKMKVTVILHLILF